MVGESLIVSIGVEHILKFLHLRSRQDISGCGLSPFVMRSDCSSEEANLADFDPPHYSVDSMYVYTDTHRHQCI